MHIEFLLNIHKSIIRFSSFLALFFMFLGSTIAQPDLKLGLNPGTKNTSAVLELESTTKGFLRPRMTTVQMTAIATPATGLEIFNTDDSCVYVRRSLSWVSTCGSAWNPSGLFTVSNGLTKSATTIPNVTLGGTLTQATTLVNGGFNFNVTGTGNVGIGTATPGSTLSVNGSMSLAIVYAVDPYTLGSSDYIVLAEPSSASGAGPYASLTLTLPTAVAAGKGRVYVVGKTDETTANIVTFSQPLYFSTTTSITTLNFAHKYKIISDGSKWWIIEGQ